MNRRKMIIEVSESKRHFYLIFFVLSQHDVYMHKRKSWYFGIIQCICLDFYPSQSQNFYVIHHFSLNQNILFWKQLNCSTYCIQQIDSDYQAIIKILKCRESRRERKQSEVTTERKRGSLFWHRTWLLVSQNNGNLSL